MLECAVFLAGAAVMSLELLATRVLAPHLGTSLFTWTALIATFLLALALGAWAGGTLADRAPRPRTLALLLVAASAATALLPFAAAPLLGWLAASPADLRLRALAASFLFTPPAALLGAVSPLAARIRIQTVNSCGAQVGRLYAVSTLGSLAGTLATGFFLLAWIGSARLLLLQALLLLAASFLAEPRALLPARGAALVALALSAMLAPAPTLALPNAQLVADVDSPYQRLLVFDLPLAGRAPARVLAMGAEEYHSAQLLDQPAALPLDYTRFFRLAPALLARLDRALTIGAGAYSQPRDLLRQRPTARVDVVELDPAVTELAASHFGLQPDARLRIFHEDGRTFLNRGGGAVYDAIFLDVFRGRTVPFHLITEEAVGRMEARLAPHGILSINLVATLEGPGSRLFRALHRTLCGAFPQVLTFAVGDPAATLRPQNVVMLALRDAAPAQAPATHSKLWSHRYTKSVPHTEPPFSDDFAPVDQYALLIPLK